ncbi:hypothetical protein MACK_002277 [Theileria orientalis]|uniref:Cleavage and polyadenylation specificity factor n=1 Tax=Theileria orientalis TaxID=68886 RepID=A0A976MBE2_THEOR|nr:hypothetical protein MACK_002277 [Theileria orientalis]
MKSLKVTILGAGQDVGRSCVVVTFPSKRVVFDCGAHCGFVDHRRYPNLEYLGNMSEYNHQMELLEEMKSDETQPDNTITDPFSMEASEREYRNTKLRQESSERALYMKNALKKALNNVTNTIDSAIISHFHLDHVGALPFLTEEIGYSGPVYLTYPTKALSPLLLRDSVQVTRYAQEDLSGHGLAAKTASVKSLLNFDKRRKVDDGKQDPWGYSFNSVSECMKRSIPLQLRSVEKVEGLTVSPFYAGHVLGAAMFLAESDGFKVLYTGDFNTVPDKHLGPAKVPSIEPDVLICETTYATFVRQSKKATEVELCNLVHDTLINGGKVLIPVFAVGRAQELAIILNNYWNNLSLLFPIYFGGGLSEKATNYYKLHSSWTDNNNISKLKENPFSMENLLQFDQSFLNDNRPMVLFATPGMVHTGLSLKACKMWSSNPKNLILIPGYCVQGTVGNKLISGEKSIKTNTGVINIKCKVKYLSFSAHADSPGILKLIKHVRPRNIVFVHGELDSMKKFSKHVTSTLNIPVYYPANGETVSFHKVLVDKKEIYIHPSLILDKDDVSYGFKHNGNVYLYNRSALVDVLSNAKSSCNDMMKTLKDNTHEMTYRLTVKMSYEDFFTLTELIVKLLVSSSLSDRKYTANQQLQKKIFKYSTLKLEHSDDTLVVQWQQLVGT